MTDFALMKRAREKLAAKKTENEEMYAERRETAYAKLPRLRSIDIRLAGLISEAVAKAVEGGGNAGDAVRQACGQSLELQAQRAELLASQGYPIDYLDEKPLCDKCRDSGFTGVNVCSCLRKLYEAETRRQLSSLLKLGEERFEKFRLEYYSDAADETGVSPRECMETVLETCRAFAHRFGRGSVNLLFQGGVGLGKTFLSASIARVVSEKGFSVVYESAVAALEVFENQKFGRGSGDEDERETAVNRLLECDLLIFDDLGTEMSTSFSQSALYTLINTRLVSGKTTIISTNLTDSELERRYTKQIISRLMGDYLNLSFTGNDIRSIKKAHGLA